MLKKLWSFSKPRCVALIFFIILMLFLNYKRGAVMSPVFQYGMFSSPVYISDTQNVYLLKADGQLVDLSRFSFAQRDIIQNSLRAFASQRAGNEIIFNTMRVILDRPGIGQLMKPKCYSNELDDYRFSNWFKDAFTRIYGQPIKLLEVFKARYCYTHAHFKQISVIEKQNFIIDKL